MTALESLKCLLDEGVISQAEFNSLVKTTRITNDLGASLAIAGMGSPISMTSIGPVDEITPVSPANAPASATKAVLTAHGNSALFTVTGDAPAAGVGHILPEGVNVNMTVQEYNALAVLALDNSSAVTITVTFYA